MFILILEKSTLFTANKVNMIEAAAVTAFDSQMSEKPLLLGFLVA
jgi:hypothetical protein